MTLVPSLLQAIVIMDGEALVLHVGERPYVVTDEGQITISNAPLSRAAVDDVLGELLPADSRRAFEDLGATQCEVPVSPAMPDEHFAVVAARGGDDVWVEIRRISNQPEALPDPSSPARVAAPRPEPPAPLEAPTPAVVPRIDPATPARTSRLDSPVRESAPARVDDAPTAVVVPIAQPSIRTVVQPMPASVAPLDQWLRVAAARGASALYLVAGSAPVMRVDGDIRPIDGAPVLSAFEVESWLLSLAIETMCTGQVRLT